jgi:hypothetical protein
MSFFRGGGANDNQAGAYSRLPPGAGGGLPGGPRLGREAPQQPSGIAGLVDRWAPSYGGEAPPQYMSGGRGQMGPR